MLSSEVKKPLQIGITGGIGSGKSLVCRIFSCLRIPVYDSDSRAKSLMTTDGILISEIRKEFGDLSYSKGELNRQYLAEAVFGDEKKLKRLNELVHPRVAADYASWLLEHCNAPYILKEAALLYESGSYSALDKVIVVYAQKELRIKRVMERDKERSPQQIEEIMRRQWPDELKRDRADYVLVNDETMLLIPQVLELHEQFVGPIKLNHRA